MNLSRASGPVFKAEDGGEPGIEPGTKASGRWRSDKQVLWERYAYRILAIAAVGIVALGTVVFHYLEGWSWVDSFYFSAVAGSTVGFGDLSPTTDASKLLSVVYIFSSVAILGTFLNERMKYHGIVGKRAVHKATEVVNSGQAGAPDNTG